MYQFDGSENQKNTLKLEIWREIMRNKAEFYPSHGGLGSSIAQQIKPASDPVACATKAVETFNALYPQPVLTVTIPADTPRRRAAKQKTKRRTRR